MLFKFQVNRMKIEDFRNPTEVVDFLVYVDRLVDVDLKINWLVEFNEQICNSSFKIQIKRIKISNFRNLAYVDLLASVDLKNNSWLN